MSVGVVMLVHTALGRAAQVARHWAANGCPVVIHVDKAVSAENLSEFQKSLSDLPDVAFCPRQNCEWGKFSIVAATQVASELILKRHPEIRHVYLASGACLPLRPVGELIDYLDQRPQVDFIESATIQDVRWTVGGLDEERFTLRFPFSWKRRRRLFDAYVRLQRLFGFKRQIPDGITPHIGSQWWCLTRRTLSAILQDPNRAEFERYFKRVWIPDESYFQTLARRYSTRIESRSLTLSKFDFQGKPHVFYDDHLQLLRRSDCFVARKIWPQAEKLYTTFLNRPAIADRNAEPNPGIIDRIFAKAVDRRVNGRTGLLMQGRFPNSVWDAELTATPYTVFEGFSELFDGFEDWTSRATDCRAHGHLFAPDRAHFGDKRHLQPGGLSEAARLRDYNPRAFLTNMVWNAQGDHQCFQFGPDDNQEISWDLVTDPNAHIYVISGAWAVPLFLENADFADTRKRAADMQRIESRHLDILRAASRRARVRIWTLADFIQAPMDHLAKIIEEISPSSRTPMIEAPRLKNLDGFGNFLQSLRNQGMHPYLMGDFPHGPAAYEPPVPATRPYAISRP